ncbi:HAD family hydrolase [Pectinatus frisingensis]|uniref:HAD family hydrolase n=1 Tax=Pectinatus frisingensis TaxID=865 RepID=UPI0018C46BF4|nr:HAD family phosphatase [Pectinatus frisingensis]
MKAVIFDMDGVIVDSEAIHIKTKMQTLREYGINCTQQDCLPYFGRSSRAFFSDFITQAASSISLDEIVARKHQLFLEYIADNDAVHPVKGAIALIKDFHNRQVPLALASSSVRRNIEMFLKRFGIYDCFDVVMSGAELLHSKPNPEIYLLTAKKLGIKPQECAVIEDAEAGVTAAKRAGNYCVAYCNPDYRDCGQNVSAADVQVDSLNDIDIGRLLVQRY